MTLRMTVSHPLPSGLAGEELLEYAKETVRLEADAVAGMAERIDGSFCEAVALLAGCRGRVLVSGMGKSGHVARKIAATFTCTGTPSVFLHPAEAAHGDLGLAVQGDVLVLVSNSGESDELTRIVPHFRELAIPIVALVGRCRSTLARWADVVLDVSVEREACAIAPVPTSSAVAALVMGDALAAALMRLRKGSAKDFLRCHPGGALGKGPERRVGEVMQPVTALSVTPDLTMDRVLPVMTAGACGLVVVIGNDGGLMGIVTDGDLRRGLERHHNLLKLPVSAIMTPDPVTIREDASTTQAQHAMQRLLLHALVVVNDQGRAIGVVQIFDGN